ncbi:hypothetical protein TrLO_g11154 [Triparma laevis f. longispina]|uniref:Uncharacterized protein n=1 Tax=Triparma laevis f. longispina TaxID=1714387 RepID=A0A9W7ADR1_9STRA|nr:hypothetical protein TrLO_g11154 [Triparma laevis f. longispina]
MFGGLSVKESSAPAPAPASAPKPDEETSAGSGFSFMGGGDDTKNEQGGGEKGNDDQASSSPPSSGFSFMGGDTETLEPSPDNTSFSFLTSPPTSMSAKNPSSEPSDLLSAMSEGAPPAGAGVVFGSAVAGGKKIKKVRRSKKVGESLSAT